MSKKIADVSLSFINTVYSTNSDGQIVKQINWKSDQDLPVYGEGYGTLTVVENMHEANAEGGECTWTGEAFLHDGTRGLGVGAGAWRKDGEHEWAVQWDGEDSVAGKVHFEGKIELATKTLIGTVSSRD